jgi:hypothetical protein
MPDGPSLYWCVCHGFTWSGCPTLEGEMTRVLFCGCANTYQDVKHGLGMRVHNQTKQNKRLEDRGWRCTGCGREKEK